MRLRDFFRAKRQEKLGNKNIAAEAQLSDEEISRNWVICKRCKSILHSSAYKDNLNVCPECGFHGRIGLRERISLLTDKQSFQEDFFNLEAADPLRFVDDKPYPETISKAQSKTGFNEAIVCGTARIEGVRVALAIMNFDFIGGSMGSVVGEKFTRIGEKALSERLPFICLSSSGGARMHEGILSLMQMAKTSITLARLSEARIPFISILTDPTFGGVAASFASLGDFMIAEPGSRIGFAGRRVIEETVKEKLPDDFQTAEYLLEHGQIDFIVPRKDLRSKIGQILRTHGFVPDNFQVSSHFSHTEETNKVDKASKNIPLEFERPLLNIQKEIQTLESKVKNKEEEDLFKLLKRQYKEVEANIYKNLSAIDITKIARHPNRPNIEDYLNMFCLKGKWLELHGDRAGKDDHAMLCALVELEGMAFIAVGTRKGRNIKDNQKRNFGMPQPEGYRKAKRWFEHANKFSLPIVTFIDTPGAYPGLTAEAHGQSIAIAQNLKTMANLEVPVLAIITGEGGSGGALAIGLANKVLMLENSVYSVISPEGCAAILWRTKDKAAEAAEALKITAKDLKNLDIIDEIVPEPIGGAHKDWESISGILQELILRELKELKTINPSELKTQRMQKFYSFGKFQESRQAQKSIIN
jgi:acyl-CoA carboxylase subunit beta